MWLEGNDILANWNTVTMRQARVVSDKFKIVNAERQGKHVEDYFNWAISYIIDWANQAKPLWVTKIPLPTEIPGLLKLTKLKMEVNKDFISFGMDPTFIANTKNHQ